jgi:hypothetical protein
VTSFRDRLVATLKALRPLLAQDGVLVVGSEVPNLMQPGAASTLVVSQDVDVAIPLSGLEDAKAILRGLNGLVPSAEEPSVFVPSTPDLIEANFLGLDTSISSADETYVHDDPELPLMVFGPLGNLRPGPVVDVDGTRVRLPKPAGLILEKLLTDRTGEKGARDLLVVAGLFVTSTAADLDEFVALARALPMSSLHEIRSNLSVLTLMDKSANMPDPVPLRHALAGVLDRIGGKEQT